MKDFKLVQLCVLGVWDGLYTVVEWRQSNRISLKYRAMSFNRKNTYKKEWTMRAIYHRIACKHNHGTPVKYKIMNILWGHDCELCTQAFREGMFICTQRGVMR